MVIMCISTAKLSRTQTGKSDWMAIKYLWVIKGVHELHRWDKNGVGIKAQFL